MLENGDGVLNEHFARLHAAAEKKRLQLNAHLRTPLAALLSILLFEGIHMGYISLSGVELDSGHWRRALIDVGYTTLLSAVLQFPIRWWLGTYKLKKAR